MKKILCSLIFVLISSLSFAQLSNKEVLYSSTNTTQFFSRVETLDDGGYIAGGTEQNPDTGSDFFIARFDANGNEVWKKNISSSFEETLIDLAITANQIVVGGNRMQLEGGKNDIVFYSLDLDGNSIQSFTIEGNGDDYLNRMIALENGNLAVAYSYENEQPTGNDIYLQVYEPDFNLVAETAIITDWRDGAMELTEIANTGEIILTGNRPFAFIRSYSSDLSTMNWEQTVAPGSSSLGIISGVLVLDDNRLAVIANEQFANFIFVGFIDLNTGMYTEHYTFSDIIDNVFPFAAERFGDSLYIGVEDDNFEYKFVLPFDLNSNTFLDRFELDGNPLGFAMHDSGKMAIVGEDNTLDYEVGRIQQFDVSDFSLDWETESGDFLVFDNQLGRGISVIEEEGFYLSSLLDISESYGIRVQKIDNEGVVLWETDFDIDTLIKGQYTVLSTPDGGCVVPYYVELASGPQILRIQKLSETGNLEWTQDLEYGNGFFPLFGDIINASGGGFYIGSTVNTNDGRRGYFAKITDNGEVIEEHEYAVSENSTRIYNLIEADNSEVIMVGYNDSPQAIPCILRVTGDGNVIWSNNYNPPVDFARFTGVVEAEDGSIYAGGYAFSSPITSINTCIYHIAADGTILNGGYREDFSDDQFLYELLLKPDGQLISSSIIDEILEDNLYSTNRRGRSLSIEHYDASLELETNQNYGVGLAPVSFKMTLHPEGGLAIFGFAANDKDRHLRLHTIEAKNSGYLITIDGEGVISTHEIKDQGYYSIQPTITTRQTKILLKSPHNGNLTLQIFDSNGKVVKTMEAEKFSETWEQTIDLGNLPQGNYYARIDLAGYAWVKPIIKIGS